MMKENDIRPRKIEKLINEKRLEDIQRIFFGKKKATSRKWFVDVPCVACENEDTKFIFKKDRFSFRKCQLCNTVFVSPRPIPQKLNEFYTSAESIRLFVSEILEKTAFVRKKHIFVPRRDRLRNLLKKFEKQKGVLVEVGGGNGLFLELVKKAMRSMKFINIEPSPQAAEISRKKGIITIEKPIENVKGLDGSCDVVVAFELIEHLFSPRKFLYRCQKMLKQNGLIYLTTPNIEGFDLFVLGKYSGNIGAPNHLNYFTVQSLSALLRDCGFCVLHVSTPGVLDLNIVENKVREGFAPENCVKFLLQMNENQKKNFQKFLQKNKLSSSMAILAQKR